MVELFYGLAAFVSAGFLYFWIVRPILDSVRPAVTSTTMPAPAADRAIATSNVAAESNGRNAISPIATPETSETEDFGFTTVSAFDAVAALIEAGLITNETKALEAVCGVRAGSSRKYIAARDALVAAKAKREPPEVVTPYAYRRTRAVFRDVD